MHRTLQRRSLVICQVTNNMNHAPTCADGIVGDHHQGPGPRHCDCSRYLKDQVIKGHGHCNPSVLYCNSCWKKTRVERRGIYYLVLLQSASSHVWTACQGTQWVYDVRLFVVSARINKRHHHLVCPERQTQRVNSAYDLWPMLRLLFECAAGKSKLKGSIKNAARASLHMRAEYGPRY